MGYQDAVGKFFCLPAEISNLPPILYANFLCSLLTHKSFKNANLNPNPDPDSNLNLNPMS